MVRRCAIMRCENSKGKPQTSVHLISKNDHDKRKLWINFIEKENKGLTFPGNYDNYGICSVHFPKSDFINPVNEQNTQDKKKRRVRDTSAPVTTKNPRIQIEIENPGTTFHAPSIINVIPVLNNISNVQNNPSSTTTINNQNQRILQNNIMHSDQPIHNPIPVSITQPPQISNQMNNNNNNDNNNSLTINQNLTSENECTNIDDKNYEIMSLQFRLKRLEEEMKKRDTVIEEKNTKIKEMQTEMKELEQFYKEQLKTKIHKILSKIFTECQIKFLLRENACFSHWDSVTLSKAIALNAVSSRALEFLVDELKYPFPCVRTVNRYLQKIEIRPNKIMFPILNVMRVTFENKSPMYCQAILAMDEMDIDPRYDIDLDEERIYGGMKKALAISVRGLFYDWKQIIYYSFHGRIDKPFFNDLIKRLYAVNVVVVGVVSDMGSNNQGLWRDYGICQMKNGKLNKTFIQHPNTNEQIFFFPDFPHLWKLLRNHILDDGLTIRTEDDEEFHIGKKLIEDLLSKSKSEFTAAYKLSNKHIMAKGKTRQNVSTAFQFLSFTTSKAILRFMPECEKEAEFFSIMNDFSDLANSRINKAHPFNDYKSPFGLRLEKQHELIEKVLYIFENMSVGDKKRGKYKPFQKGLIVFINSLLGLYKNMTDDPINAHYIKPAKLNQDYLENSFGCIRGQSGFKTYPSALEFKNRMKKLLFSRNFYASQKSPVSCEDNGEYLSSAFGLHRLLEILTEKPEEEEAEDVTDSAIQAEVVKLRLEQVDLDIEVSTDDSPPSFQCAEEKLKNAGEENVAGYIASKLIAEYPEFGRRVGIEDEPNGSWIREISRGGLVEPSSMWMLTFRKFNEIFDAFHGFDSVNKRRFVYRDLIEYLCRHYTEIPRKVIQFYVKTRTNVRLRFLNKKIENKKYSDQERWRKKNKGQSNNEEDEEDAHHHNDGDEEIMYHDPENVAENEEGIVENGIAVVNYIEHGEEQEEEIHEEAEYELQDNLFILCDFLYENADQFS